MSAPERYRLVTDYEGYDEPLFKQATQVLAFCKANDLNPDQIPATGSFRIVGDEIRYREHADPKTRTGETEWKTVPMVSPPEDHGVDTFEVVAAEVIAERLEAELLTLAGYGPGVDPGAAMVSVTKRQAVHLATVVQEIVANEVSR